MENKIKVAYIAGPLTAPTQWQREQNIRAAEEVSIAAARILGVFPYTPHSSARYFWGEISDEFWIEGELEILRRCDMLVLCPGYENSKGTIAEIEEAVRLEKEIFYAKNILDLDKGSIKWCFYE